LTGSPHSSARQSGIADTCRRTNAWISRTRIVDRKPTPCGARPPSTKVSIAHCIVSANRLFDPFSSAPVRISVLLNPENW
jgi:hypothetical protein